MIWNSANPTEFSNVREFAQKKKLALIAAHDSIIGARVKQAHDANRKRQVVPFKEGDFAYLSTKNITFAKGLARKLIPKYIGPYRIIRDYNNQSFRLELPTHLKKRDVHDVFHSSLLRIHIPNDDRLFPGRMDTQLGDGPSVDDEWAVDVIRNHAGSGNNSVFEILWKSGDVTWMPLYQIKHLQALETYLELMGITDASKLPAGKGNPPQEDPQLFLGELSLSALSFSTQQHSSLSPVSSSPVLISFITPSSTPLFLHLNHKFFDSISSLPFNFPLLYSTSFQTHTQLTLDHLTNLNVMKFNGIRHSHFVRNSTTEYALVHPDRLRRDLVHVSQIRKYLIFDRFLREGQHLTDSTDIPIGYETFANLFNTGTRPSDLRRISTYLEEAAGYRVIKSTNPVSLDDFFITSDQCGFSAPRPAMSDSQAAIVEEYATTMAYKNKRRREAIQDRKDNRRTMVQDRRDNHPQRRSMKRFNPIKHNYRDVSESVFEDDNQQYSLQVDFLNHHAGPSSSHTPSIVDDNPPAPIDLFTSIIDVNDMSDLDHPVPVGTEAPLTGDTDAESMLV